MKTNRVALSQEAERDGSLLPWTRDTLLLAQEGHTHLTQIDPSIQYCETQQLLFRMPALTAQGRK